MRKIGIRVEILVVKIRNYNSTCYKRNKYWLIVLFSDISTFCRRFCHLKITSVNSVSPIKVYWDLRVVVHWHTLITHWICTHLEQIWYMRLMRKWFAQFTLFRWFIKNDQMICFYNNLLNMHDIWYRSREILYRINTDGVI
jgi:hypothetical protein